MLGHPQLFSNCCNLGTVFFIAASLPISLMANPTNAEGVAGKWKITINGGGEIYTAYVTLIQSKDGKLTGRFENEGRRAEIKTAVLKNKTLTFVANTQRFSTPVVATFTCDLEGNGKMTGEVDFDSGSRSRSYDFEGELISQASNKEKAVGPSDASKDFESTAQEAKMPPVQSTSTTGNVPQTQSTTVTFQQGLNGYEKTTDLEIWSIAPTKSLLKQGTMTTDGNNGGGESQVLLRFDGVFGNKSEQVPKNVRIKKATLTVIAFDPGTTCYIHRMLIPWTAAATWDGLANGVSIDNTEASTVRDGFTFGEINMDKQSVKFDVTATVQKWAAGAKNNGWVFRNTGSNGWDFYSSDWIETELHPSLEITFEK